MKQAKIALFVVGAFAARQSAFAEEAKLSTDLEFGWIATSGNTDTSSVKGIANITHNTKKWKHNYMFSGYGSQSADAATDETKTSAEKYSAAMKNVYKLKKDRAGLFVATAYEDDRFSGYEYQATLAVGYADRLFDGSKSYIDYSIGPGYGANKVDEKIAEDEVENSFIIQLFAKYAYQFNENVKFEQTISSDVNTDSDKNTKTKASSAITANLNNALALKAAFSINYNSEAPNVIDGGTIKHADTQTSMTLVYSF